MHQFALKRHEKSKCAICDERGWLLLMLGLTHNKISPTEICMREILNAVTPGAPDASIHPSKSPPKRGGSCSHHEGGGGVRAGWIHKRALGPPPPSATVPLCGEFRWLQSLARSRFSLLSPPCSVAARALIHCRPSPTAFISRYLFTPTFYCHWIPTGQTAIRPRRNPSIYKVIKSNLFNSRVPWISTFF